MPSKIEILINKNRKARNLYHQYRSLKYTIKHKINPKKFDLNRKKADIQQQFYVAYFMEFLCNFRCSYCIQDDINRKEYERTDIDKVINYLKNEVKYREKNLTIIGGEVTLNKNFPYVIEALHNDFYITVGTNLKTRFFKNDFDEFIRWAKEHRVRWNVTYHPEFMDVDLFIERVRKIQEADLEMGQVSAVKSSLLPEEDQRKLEQADIGITYQELLGIDESTRILHPTEDTHPLFDYDRYKEMCGKHIKETRSCKTVDYDGHARHLIGPDGRIYNCHHLLYKEMHPIGHIDEGWPEHILDPIKCTEYGHCNPCDFYDMEVLE